MLFGKAIVDFVANLNPLKKGMAEGQTAVTTGTAKMGQAFKGLASMAGSALGGISVAYLAKEAIDTADRMNEMAIKTGVASEELSVLGYVADQSGSSLDDVATAFRVLANTRNSAVSGNKEVIASYDKLGIKLRELKGLSGKDLLVRVADGLANTTSATDRLVLAQQTLGKSAQGLLPTMQELANGGYKRSEEAAKKLGLILSTDLVQAADQFNDSIGKLKATFMSGANPAMREALPIVNALVGANLDGAASTASWLNPVNLLAATLRYVVLPIFITGKEIITTFFRSAGEGVSSFGKAAYELLWNWNPKAALAEFTKSGVKQMDLWAGVSDRVGKSMDGLFPVFDQIKPKLDDVGTGGRNAADGIREANQAAQASVLQLRIQSAELHNNSVEAERLRKIQDSLTASKLREQGVAESLIAAIIKLTQANREYEEAQAKLKEINQGTVDGLREEKQALDESYAATQRLLDMDIEMRRARAQAINDLQLLAIAERDSAELAAQRRAEEISKLKFSLDEKRRLIRMSEEQLAAELAEINLRYETGWKGALARTIQEHKRTATTLEDITKETSANLQYALGDALYAAITGNLDDIEDAFKDFFKSLLRQIVNLMAQRAVMMLLGKLGGGGGAVDAISGLAVSGHAAGGVLAGGFKAFAAGSSVVSDPTLGLVGEGRFDEGVVPLPNRGSIPVELYGGNEPKETVIQQRIVLSSDMLQAMKTNPNEIITVITSDILRGGEVRKAIRSRT